MVQTTKRAAVASVLAVLAAAGGWCWLQGREEGAPAPQAALVRPLGSADASPSPLALQTSPPRGALSIQGSVFGSDGPVAAATVYAFPAGPGPLAGASRCDCPDHCTQDSELRGLQWESCPRLGEAVLERAEEAQTLPPLARATTSATGTYALAGLDSGRFIVWAERGGRTGVLLDVWAGTSEARVELDEGRELRGRVVDERGGGLVGLEVWAVEPTHGRFFRAPSTHGGRFTFESLPRGNYLLAARREGLLAATTQVLERMTEEVELRLVAPRTVAGRVVRRDTPAAGVPVVLEGPHGTLSLQSDPKGRFEFAGLAPGPYSVSASEGPFAARAAVALDLGEDVRDLVLTLAPTVQVKGVVRSSSTGPLREASVTALIGDRPRLTSRADSAGRFALQLFEAGTYGFVARAPGHRPLRVERTVSALAPLDLDLQLETATLVQGTVVDEAGRPLREASIECRPEDWANEVAGPLSLPSPTDRSAADGTFTLELASPGDCELLAEHRSFRSATQAVRAPVSGLQVVLQRGLTLRGVVVDEGEKPVADVTVEAGLDPGGEDRGELQSLRQTRTNSRGEFELQGLEAGRHRVLALSGDEASGAGGPLRTLRTATAVVEVAPDGPPVRLRFAAGLTLAGLVVDQHGRPVLDALVSAVPELDADPGEERDVERLLERASMGSTRTGPDGRFRIDNLKAGRFRVRASRRGYQRSPAPVVARAGDGHVRLELTARGQIRGRVLRPDGTPVPEFRVNQRPMQHETGEFELPVEQTGEQLLAIEARGHATVFRTVRTTLGEDLELGTIVVGSGRAVLGLVREAGSGLPVAEAVVRLAPAGTKADLLRPLTTDSATTRADGRFVLEHVDGAATLLVSCAGYRDGTAELGEHQQSTIVQLARGGRIEGLALSADGSPLAGARVIARAGALRGDAGVADTGLDGRFEISGLAGGRYALRLQLGIREGFEQPISMAPSEVGVPAEGVAQAVDARYAFRLHLAIHGGLEDHEVALAPVEVTVPPEGVARTVLRASAQATRLKVRLSGTGPRPNLLLLGPATTATPASTGDLIYLAFASEEAEPGSDGTFTFAPVPPATYALFLVADDGPTIRLSRQAVHVGPQAEQLLELAVPAETAALPERPGPTAIAAP